MAGEPTHTASEKAPRAPAISIIVWKVKLPLCFVVSYVQPITQHFNQELVESISGRSESLFGFSFTSPILPHRRKGKLRLIFG